MDTFSPTKLRRLRWDRDLTQQALADASDVNLWTVMSWERGKHVPFGRNLARLAKALGVEVEDLLEEQQPAAAVATGRRSEVPAGRKTRKGDRDAVR